MATLTSFDEASKGDRCRSSAAVVEAQQKLTVISQFLWRVREPLKARLALTKLVAGLASAGKRNPIGHTSLSAPLCQWRKEEQERMRNSQVPQSGPHPCDCWDSPAAS